MSELAKDSLDEVLARARSRQTSPTSIFNRLVKKFGLGEKPEARRQLYYKLEKLAEGKHEEAVIQCISEAVMESGDARKPANYFCSAVKRKLIDREIWAKPENAEW
jgi:hypothetical protein